MHRLLVCVLLLTVALAAGVPARAVERQVNLVRIADPTLIPLQVSPKSSQVPDCTVGNAEVPGWIVNDFIYVPEMYELTFEPSADCAICEFGFQVETIHIAMDFAEPGSVVLEVSQSTAAGLAGNPGCDAPETQLYTSGLFPVTIDTPGLYDIAVPITADCTVDVIFPHTLGVFIHDVQSQTPGVVPGLVTDNSPTLCKNWNDYGFGPGDLVQDIPTWPGNLIIWADVTCCNQSVPVDTQSWGAIKQLFQ